MLALRYLDHLRSADVGDYLESLGSSLAVPLARIDLARRQVFTFAPESVPSDDLHDLQRALFEPGSHPPASRDRREVIAFLGGILSEEVDCAVLFENILMHPSDQQSAEIADRIETDSSVITVIRPPASRDGLTRALDAAEAHSMVAIAIRWDSAMPSLPAVWGMGRVGDAVSTALGFVIQAYDGDGHVYVDLRDSDLARGHVPELLEKRDGEIPVAH